MKSSKIKRFETSSYYLKIMASSERDKTISDDELLKKKESFKSHATLNELKDPSLLISTDNLFQTKVSAY